MHSTVSVLLLINKKKGIFYKKNFTCHKFFLLLGPVDVLSQVVRPGNYPALLGSSQRDRVASWTASLSRAEEREEWPCIGAGRGRLALRPPAQQPAPPNASSQVSPRAQSKETKHRHSQSCCPPRNTGLESVTTALYQLPLCSCLLSDQVD